MLYVLLGNRLEEWAVAIGVAIATAGVMIGLKKLIICRLEAMARQTPAYLDNLGIKVVRATGPIFITVISIYAGAQFVELQAKYAAMLTKAAIGMMLLQTARWGDAGLHDWMRHYRNKRTARDVASTTSTAALGFLLRATLWLVIALMILDNFGVNITALVASLGIGGIAVALATQNILGDLFSSLSIVLDKPFVVGDFIIIDDVLGTVEYVGLKSTRIAALGGEQVVMSNSDLLKSRIHNHKRMQARRIVFVIAVSYDVSTEQLEAIPRILREVVTAQKNVNFDRAHFRSYSPSSLDFEIVYFVDTPDYNLYMDIQQNINMTLFQRFKEMSIAFANPTQTVHIARTSAHNRRHTDRPPAADHGPALATARQH